LTFNPANLRFGEIVVGQTGTLSATMTNKGSTSITISTISVTAVAFAVHGLTLPLTLAPAQSVGFTVTFSPTALGLASGAAVFNGNAASLGLGGLGVSSRALTANPPTLAFGNVQTGNTVTMPVTLTNSRNASVTISQESTHGAGFAVSGLSLPLTLAPGQSFTFSITFSPQSAGAVIGGFQGWDSATFVLGVPLTGTGTAPGRLTVAPGTINFGNVTVGKNSSQSGTLRATGAAVTVTSATSSSSEFTLSGLSFPVTISAGQSAPFTVTFAPQSSGAASATVSFASNASNSPAVESLTGSGIAPQQYSVDLSWNASTSPVVGYNVYRGGSSGGPYSKVNSVLDASTTYTDSTVAASTTYYYVTTAVNSSGQESAYSNQVQVVVP
jgi:hypothetical protein